MQPREIVSPAYELALVRLPEPRLLAPIFALASQPQVSAGMEWEPHATVDDTRAFFDFCASDLRDGSGLHFAVESRAAAADGDVPDGTVLGVASLLHIDRHVRRAEVTTWLGERFWGRRLNGKAKHLLFQLAFEHLGLEKLVMRVAVDNTASVRSHARLGTVLEGVLRRELVIRGRLTDCNYYGLLAEDYARSYARIELDLCADDAAPMPC